MATLTFSLAAILRAEPPVAHPPMKNEAAAPPRKFLLDVLMSDSPFEISGNYTIFSFSSTTFRTEHPYPTFLG
jgi:hypothetical protein